MSNLFFNLQDKELNREEREFGTGARRKEKKRKRKEKKQPHQKQFNAPLSVLRSEVSPLFLNERGVSGSAQGYWGNIYKFNSIIKGQQ